MEVTTALLADFANVRDGLLNVIGGGITRLYRPQLPAPLGVCLALVIDVHPTEFSRPHQLQVILQDVDGQRLGQIDSAFQLPTVPEIGPAEHLFAPLAFDLRMAGTNSAGSHSVDILVDGTHRRTLSFVVVIGPPPIVPPPASPAP